jgi:F-type H+-transporting ATPase subunit delta
MIETKVAKRYAKSLIDLSVEKGIMNEASADMNLFIAVCSKNHELTSVLSSPIIHSFNKSAILQKIFSEKVNKVTMKFFEIIVKKGREKYLLQIAKEFISQYKVIKKIMTAEIISAAGLDDKLRKQVYEILRKQSDSEVELIEKTDSKLIGGFILRVGDYQYDASIASDLRKLAQSFSTVTFTKQN